MKRKKAMKEATLYIIYFGIAAKILSFIKGILTASKIGINYKMDSYLLAFSTIMLLTSIISDGIIVSIIPLLQEIQERYGKERKVDYTNNLVNITAIVSLLIIITGFISAPIIVKVFGPGFKGRELEKTIQLFRMGLPIVAISWINAIFSGFLQSVHSFKGGPKGRVASAIIYIIYLLFFAKTYALKGLMITGIITALFQVYIFRKGLIKNGFKYKWKFDLKDRYIKKSRQYLIPILTGVGINELNISIDNAVASTLPSGSIAELSYANEIIDLFLGVFIAAIITVIFPILSEDYNRKDEEHLRNEVEHGINLLLVITVPVSIILMTMSGPIVKIIFERGAFDAKASLFTARTLAYYAIGLAAMAIIPLITRAYYSIQDMKTPIIISIVALGINTILDICLAPNMGSSGIALGTSISIILALLYGIYDLNQRLQITKDKNINDTVLKVGVATVVMTESMFLTYGTISTTLHHLLSNNILEIGFSAIAGVGAYAEVCKVLRLKI